MGNRVDGMVNVPCVKGRADGGGQEKISIWQKRNGRRRRKWA